MKQGHEYFVEYIKGNKTFSTLLHSTVYEWNVEQIQKELNKLSPDAKVISFKETFFKPVESLETAIQSWYDIPICGSKITDVIEMLQSAKNQGMTHIDCYDYVIKPFTPITKTNPFTRKFFKAELNFLALSSEDRLKYMNDNGIPEDVTLPTRISQEEWTKLDPKTVVWFVASSGDGSCYVRRQAVEYFPNDYICIDDEFTSTSYRTEGEAVLLARLKTLGLITHNADTRTWELNFKH